MNKKLIIGAIFYLILLSGMAIYFILTNSTNYVSAKNQIKVIQERLDNPTPEVTLGITPKPTPEVTPKVTPELTPEITPSPTPEATPKPTPSNDSNEETYANISFTRNMKSGNTGDDIKKLQYLLMEKNFYQGKIDGLFGKMTFYAVKEFQKSKNLTADGVAGPITCQILLEDTE